MKNILRNYMTSQLSGKCRDTLGPVLIPLQEATVLKGLGNPATMLSFLSPRKLSHCCGYKRHLFINLPELCLQPEPLRSVDPTTHLTLHLEAPQPRAPTNPTDSSSLLSSHSVSTRTLVPQPMVPPSAQGPVVTPDASPALCSGLNSVLQKFMYIQNLRTWS